MVTKVYDNPEIWSIYVDMPQNPLRNLNAYVIRSAGRNLIIDTGFNRPECREALWEGIRQLGIDMTKTDLFVTHLHSDHAGLAPEFVEQGCTVYMNEIDYEYFCRMKKGEVWPYMEDLFCREGFPKEELPLQLTGNQGRRYAPASIFPIVPVQDGTRLQVGEVELMCIHTPGHTPGHTVLYLPESQILFSGDHILFDITPNISIWMHVPHSLRDYKESLRKIDRLPIKVTFPAHRKNSEDVHGRIAEILEHHKQRLEEIWNTVASDPGADADAIASRIQWSSRGKPWGEFPPHQKWFAMGETLAHLYTLVDDGRVVRQENEDAIRYFVTDIQ